MNGDILRNLNGWSWSLGGNIGFNKSKIGDLGFAPTDFGTLKNVRGYQGTSIGDHFGIANLFIAGEAPGLFFGYKTQGIIQPEDIVDGKVAYTAAGDMSGLIPPARTAELVRLFKKSLKVPVDFHTHCTPGYGLASVVSAIINGVDIVDTNIWNFAGGPAAPAVELVYIFCKKLGIELDLDMDAIAKINKELLTIRKELSAFDTAKKFPRPFNPVEDSFPAEIDRFFNDAIEAARKDKEDDLLLYCRAIEEYFDFPEPNELVKKAQIPGGMYTNMVAQLKQLGQIDLLEKAMSLIPQVRMDAGLPPLVTPTSQIIGAQAVSCALDELKGRPMYSNPSNQFIALVKGEYGKTPIPVDPAFRLKITGVQNEVPYDGSHYVMQENPVLEDLDVLLAENEKEILLLELFPTVARTFLTKWKEQKARSNV